VTTRPVPNRSQPDGEGSFRQHRECDIEKVHIVTAAMKIDYQILEENISAIVELESRVSRRNEERDDFEKRLQTENASFESVIGEAEAMGSKVKAESQENMPQYDSSREINAVVAQTPSKSTAN
jgi:hypothetical protein